MEHDLMTAEQLAERLGVKPRTIRGWMRAGIIPSTRLTPKVIRFDLEQVVTALKQRQAATEVRDANDASTKPALLKTPRNFAEESLGK